MILEAVRCGHGASLPEQYRQRSAGSASRNLSIRPHALTPFARRRGSCAQSLVPGQLCSLDDIYSRFTFKAFGKLPTHLPDGEGSNERGKQSTHAPARSAGVDAMGRAARKLHPSAD